MHNTVCAAMAFPALVCRCGQPYGATPGLSTSIKLTNNAGYKVTVKAATPCVKVYGDVLAILQPGESTIVYEVSRTPYRVNAVIHFQNETTIHNLMESTHTKDTSECLLVLISYLFQIQIISTNLAQVGIFHFRSTSVYRSMRLCALCLAGIRVCMCPPELTSSVAVQLG